MVGKQTQYSSLLLSVVIPALAAVDVAVVLSECALNMSVLTPVYCLDLTGCTHIWN